MHDAANLENTSSESSVRGRLGGGKWARKVVKRREMVMNLCRGLAGADKSGERAMKAPYPNGSQHNTCHFYREVDT